MATEPKDIRLPIMVTASEAAAIDDFRFKNRINTRAEAIRQLIHTGLAARPILVNVQKMLVELRPVGGESDLDKYIEAIHAALNSKSD